MIHLLRTNKTFRNSKLLSLLLAGFLLSGIHSPLHSEGRYFQSCETILIYIDENQLSITDTSEAKILDSAIKLIDEGCKNEALELLDKSTEKIRRPGLIYSITYLDLAASLNRKELFGKATTTYLVSLSGEMYSEEEKAVLLLEMHMLTPLLSSDDKERLIQFSNNEDPGKLADEIGKIWIGLDPTPTIPANQRLIEHRNRIREASEKFPDIEQPHGLDARGMAWLRYGEPDIVYDRPFNFNRGELFAFVSEFQEMQESFGISASADDFTGFLVTEDADAIAEDSDSDNEQTIRITGSSSSGTSQFDAARTTNDLMNTIFSNPFHTNINIWIYNRFDEGMDENLVFYFAETHNNVYRQIASLDDWIPQGLFRPSSRGYNASFSPALPLQYLAYQRLMHVDRQFMDAYTELENRIFNNPVERSETQLLHMASNVRTRHQQATAQRHFSAPEERSTEKDKIPEIPMNVYQYRALGSNDQPVFITFIESRPTVAFIADFLAHHEKMDTDDDGEEYSMLSNITQWYGLEHGLQLYSAHMEPRGRIRDNPVLELEDERELPAVSIADIPLIEEGAVQIIHSKLFNYHPGTEPPEESVYPDELRGLGKISIEQADHFTEGDNGLLISDLITGYGRIQHERARFPFIVSHNRTIPEGENPVIHFEVYGLQPDIDGFSRFEVDYRFEPDRRTFALFRRNRNRLTGTIEFSTTGTRFRESLEFDTLSLRPGRYTLNWRVTDTLSRETVSQSLVLDVSESQGL
jgi:GWxTD domain-containing protein